MGNGFLIVSASRGNIRALRSIASAAGGAAEALSGAQARRLLAEREFADVVIDTPLPDEPGAELALYAERRCSGGVIIFAKREIAYELEKAAAARGVIVVPKPVDRDALRVSLRALEIMRGKLALAEEENRRLRERLENERIVCRAKCFLIRRFGFDESEAHRYIEKTAMDSRCSRREIAEDIVARLGGAEAADGGER